MSYCTLFEIYEYIHCIFYLNWLKYVVIFYKYPWVSKNIKKIYGYIHNKYSYGYRYSYEVDIYLTGRVQESYYLYHTCSIY